MASPSSGVGTFFAQVSERLHALGPREQSIAQTILTEPEQVAVMTVADLAARTKTSSTTVVRACQSLGFRGFHELRLHLLRELGGQTESAEPPSDEYPDAQHLRRIARRLDNLADGVDWEAMDRAGAILAGAGRVLVVAGGGSAPAAHYWALVTTLIGRPVEYPSDNLIQRYTARLLGPEDAVLAVSQSGMNSSTIAAVTAARETGCSIVAATSYSRSRVAEEADIVLAVGLASDQWESDPFVGTFSQFATLDALFLATKRHVSSRVDVEAAVVDETLRIVEPPTR